MIEIDKHKIYESHGYKFINFVDLTFEQKKMVLSWRNHDKVRSMMVNKDLIILDDHLKFIESLKDRNDSYYWLVKDPSGVEVGVLDLIHVDYDKNEGEIGFYLNQNLLGAGVEFIIECNYFVYGILQLGNSLVTVNVNNTDILLINKFLRTTYEGTKKIDDDTFYYSNHSNGNFVLAHYNELTLLDYARFVKKHRKDSEFIF